MWLKERFEQFKAGTTHKLVQVFSKKYQPTFEEVQHHVDHTYGKKAEAIITLNGTISYFSESYIDEVQQYVNGKIMEMLPLKREWDVRDLYEDALMYGIIEAENNLGESYNSHYVPSHNAAIEYVKKQKHLPKTDRTALLDSIAHTHQQVEASRTKLDDKLAQMEVQLTVARIAKITNLEAEKTAASPQK